MMMLNGTTALDADLDYAERMVLKGFSTPEMASKMCGVKLQDLLERLGQKQDVLYIPQEQR
ncbi:MAG TPA: hypothetical protein VED01_05745 [Burkholderiales bacterium]|nr:hypothetical protein [Burkholderiales bacterium]